MYLYFQRLRDLREDSDMSQTQTAELLGIKQTVYSRYERGYQTIPLEHLIKLADYYRVSLDYLIMGDENNPLKKKVEQYEAVLKQIHETASA